MENNKTLQTCLESLDIQDCNWQTPTWVYTYVNGIKFELKIQSKGHGLTVAYHTEQPELAEVIKDEFPGFDPDRAVGVYYWVKDHTELLSLSKKVRDFIIDTGLSRGSRKAKRQTTDDGYFEGAAKVIKTAVDSGFWHILDRGSLGFDAHDKLITIGHSKSVIQNPDVPQWREHIVPCTMIIEEAVRMTEEGESIAAVAQMLKTNLAIIVITAEEAKVLDSVYQTTMPEGWVFGDSVTARLDVMGVTY